MSHTDQLTGKGAVVVVGRIRVKAFFVFAWVAGLFTLVCGLAGAIRSLAADTLSLTLALDHAPFANTNRGSVTIVSGGLVSGGVGMLASWMATDQLNGRSTGGGFWPIIGAVDGAPLVIGLIILLVGLAFEFGERLQRDTEGLV